MSKKPQAKHWCFTLNNPEPDANKIPRDEVEYMVVGREVGESGTPHLQGYVAFKKRKLLTTMKKYIPKAHFEIMRGTPAESAAYCKKDGDFDEVGVLPGHQGEKGGEKRKHDWAAAKALAISGDIEAIDPQLYVQYYNTFKRIKADHAPKVDPIPTLDHEWHYGPTGTGKSRFVRTAYPAAFVKDANRWWDGYKGEHEVILEDVDKYDVKLGRYLKLWGDHYSFPADFKHQGKLDIRPKKIIVTSNYAPREIWSDEKTFEPIERRYKLIVYYPGGSSELENPSDVELQNKYSFQ